MIRIIKYIRGSWKSVLLIFGLLVIQALCELGLPEYTSKIVDIGIQQGGIDEVVPDAVRRSEVNKLFLFMDEETRQIFSDSYEEISRADLSEKEFRDMVKKYPALADTTVLALKKDRTEEQSEKLNELLPKAEVMVQMLSSDSEEAAAMKGQIFTSLGIQDQNSDIFIVLQALTPETLEEVLRGMKQQGSGAESGSSLQEVIYKQVATQYIKSEYIALGVDVDAIQIQYIVFTGLKMLGISLLAMLAMVIVSLIASKVAAKAGMMLREKVFHKVVGFSSTEMDHFSTASLITRSTNDVQQIQMVLVLLLRMVAYAPIIGMGGVIKVLHTNTNMSWIIAVAVGAILCLVTVLMFTAMPKFKKMQTLVDKVNLVAREILTGLLVIRAFSREKHEEKRFDKTNEELMKTQLFTNRAMAFMMPAMMFIMNAITVLIVWVGAKGIDLGNLQVGDMMAFITYTMQIVIAFLMITMISIMLPRAAVSAARIDEVLETEQVLHDTTNPKPLGDHIAGEIEFKQVYFRYPNAEEDALKDLNFTIKPGETTAIIGSTGSGKSTLANLIPRLYDVTEGSITVDGKDIRDISQKELRRNIGFVPQKGILFSGTIDTNLKFGVEDASEAEMKEAAAIAQAKEFIEEKPEGMETLISQGGSNVSGGQKQRLSIARAIVKRPKIYIFDDSFSALDYKTDVALRKALKDKISDSAVVIIAQRISTILHADKILVLEDGVIAGMGTHDELLKGNEVYQQIARSQLSEEELNV